MSCHRMGVVFSWRLYSGRSDRGCHTRSSINSGNGMAMADDGEQYDKTKPPKKFLALALPIALNLLI